MKQNRAQFGGRGPARRDRVRGAGLGVLGLVGCIAYGCDVRVDEDEVAVTGGDPAAPPDGSQPTSWSATIEPVVSEYCVRCHNGSSPSGGVDLSGHAGVLASGVVVPGDPDASRLLAVVADGVMPPAGQPTPPDEAVGWIRAWIAAGAPPD
ncbi:MAG: hypothetical protein B7733_25520 [Myxococcales bacterium FL481]|nr:MAG: hypothetical protein B7733_25520 [Myxococcales bacterium FL481]